MKKALFLAATAIIVSFVSCQKEEFVTPAEESHSPIFTATIDAASTKTGVDISTGKVSWETTDTIIVTDGASKTATYKIQSIDEGGKATFVIKEGQTALGAGPYSATYGTMPSTSQTYSATAGRLYMEAPGTSSTDFTFSVKCGLMRINLAKDGESVSSVRVTGTPEGGAETTYTLTCGTAQSIASAKDFCIALPAGSYNKIQIINDKYSICTLNASSGVSVSTNRIRPVTIADSKIVFSAATGLCFEAKVAGSTVGMTDLGKTGAPVLQKSSDGINWDEGNWDGSAVTLTNVGDKVYFRAGSGGNKCFFDMSEEEYYMFSTSGDLKVSGNIMYLLNSTPVQKMTEDNTFCFMGIFANTSVTDASDLLLPATELAPACYQSMFYESSLTKAPVLSATQMSESCYYSMFSSCANLTDAPALPATSLANGCYSYMFEGCTGLENAPALPATSLANGCYSSMFEGCTGLKNAPALPATSLADECYSSMFEGCTGLKNATALSATTLGESCYMKMFEGCTELKNAPALPATSLANNCYSSMFEGCSALVSVQDILPAVTLKENCYYYMFKDCISLTKAPAIDADSLGKYSCLLMFGGCIKLTDVSDFKEDVKCGHGCCQEMFSGCTSLKNAPALPSTALGESCYMGMFAGCTELTTAPSLPAAVLKDRCYYEIFKGCSKLSSVTMLATDINCFDAFYDWLKEAGTDDSVATRTVYVAEGMVDAIKAKVPDSPDWKSGVQVKP